MKLKLKTLTTAVSAVLVLAGFVNMPAGAAGKTTIATYAAQLKAGEAAAKWAGPTTPAKAPKNIKIVIVTCDETLQGCKNLTQGVVDAATALGWSQSVVDVTNSTQYDAAVQTAVSENVNGIVAVGVDSALMTGGLAAAHTAKIPVVSLFQYNVPSATGVSAEVSPNATTEGKLLADSMIVNTKGKVNALIMNDSEYSLPIHVLSALKAQLNRCNAIKVCKVTYAPAINFLTAGIGPTLFGQVTSELQTHPKINSIAVGFDAFLGYLVNAIDTAKLGTNVKMYSQLGSLTALSSIAKSDVMATDIGASNEWGGYGAVDELIRIFDKQSVVNENIPAVALVKSNLPAAGQPYVGLNANFIAHYKTLWGIK